MNEPPIGSLIVPCQECLGLGRYWDRMGLRLEFCARCDGTGRDEEHDADE